MPQLDTLIFFNQFFWFFIWFFFIYYFFSYLVIPKINFYYFIKYNIKQSLDNLEYGFNVEKPVKYYNNQIVFELSIPYNIIFLKFRKSLSKAIIPPYKIPRSFVHEAGQIRLHALEFHLSKNDPILRRN